MRKQEGFWAFQARSFLCFASSAAATLWIPCVLGFTGPIVGAVALLQLVLFNVLRSKTDPDRVSGPGP